MSKYKYFGQPMHIHSCYQPGGSMEGQIYHVAKLGMQYTWFTDHDNRIAGQQDQIEKFDFEQKELYGEDESGLAQGFKLCDDGEVEAQLTKDDCYCGTQCLKLTATAKEDGWNGGRVAFSASSKRHSGSLLMGITLKIAAKADWNENTRVIFDVQLSERPPEAKCAHVQYVLGSTEGLGDQPHTLVISLQPVEGWHSYTLNLSEDVQSEEAVKQAVGGLDNALATFSIYLQTKNGTAQAWFDEYIIDREKRGQPVREKQQEVANEIGAKYGVTPFIGTELSSSGDMHKNCFSTKVPIIPYYEYPNFEITHEEGIAWVKDHGGIFALNHPFQCCKYDDLPDGELESRLERLAQEFIENKAWGATLMEVGFPMGRHGFDLSYYPRLWDKLTKAGIFITGYGCSDSHSNTWGWYAHNNFATWIGVPQEEAEPVCEDAFILGMKQGRAYCGDPVFLRGQAELETDTGLHMGDVLVTENAEQSHVVKFTYTQAQKGWKFRFVENGEIVAETVVDEENFAFTYTMKPNCQIHFIRGEMYNEEGRCILLTNPIYIHRKDLGDVAVPKERLVVG